jgi:hypothetical protein
MNSSIPTKKMKQSKDNGPSRAEIGRQHGRVAAEAIVHNIEQFEAAIAHRSIKIESLDKATCRSDFTEETSAELRGIASATGLSVERVYRYNRYRNLVFGQECTAAIAIGDATATNGPLFFKHSDAGINKAFEGDAYHNHQEINVVRIEDQPGSNASLLIAGAGVTGMKMGVNEHGLAIGSTFSRTTTYTAADQRDDDITVSQGSRRSEYMRDALFACETATEAAAFLYRWLADDPMDTPGNILIADPSEAIVLEGEYDHIATEFIQDGIIARGNTFELLDQLSIPRKEYESTYYRHDRILEILSESEGGIDVETMQHVSVDHANGPGGNSICVHPAEPDTPSEVDHTDEENSATCSSVIWHLDPQNPADSRLYIALGTPCTAWRTNNGEGWVCLSPTDGINDIPEEFLTGEAWLEHYQPDQPVSEATAMPPLE